jgi:hypothetical protein
MKWALVGWYKYRQPMATFHQQYMFRNQSRTWHFDPVFFLARKVYVYFYPMGNIKLKPIARILMIRQWNFVFPAIVRGLLRRDLSKNA